MASDMDRDRIDTQLPVRPVEFHILLSLAGGERHGYGIIQDIEARGDTTVPDVGTMYRALARMVESGRVKYLLSGGGRAPVERWARMHSVDVSRAAGLPHGTLARFTHARTPTQR